MSTSKSGLQARPTSWFPCCAGDGTPGSAGPTILLAFLRLTLRGAFPRPGGFDYAAPPRLHAKQLPRLFAHTARKLSVLSSRRSRMLLPLQLLLETLRTLCSPGWVFVPQILLLNLGCPGTCSHPPASAVLGSQERAASPGYRSFWRELTPYQYWLSWSGGE